MIALDKHGNFYLKIIVEVKGDLFLAKLCDGVES